MDTDIRLVDIEPMFDRGCCLLHRDVPEHQDRDLNSLLT